MKAGDPFNPSRKICGFYPPDVVGRQRQLVGRDGKLRDVTDGHKRLYERAARLTGTKGSFWWSFPKLAELLGKSERQVKSDMKALEEFGLIEHQRGRQHQPNVYTFLWHAIFEVSDVQPTARLEPDPDDSDVQDTTSRRAVYGIPDVQPTAREFSNELRKESSSSAAAAIPPATDDEPLSVEKPEAEDPLAGHLEFIRQALSDSAKVRSLPDEEIARRIVAPWLQRQDLRGNLEISGVTKPEWLWGFMDWCAMAREKGLACQARKSVWGLYLSDSEKTAAVWTRENPKSADLRNSVIAEKAEAEWRNPAGRVYVAPKKPEEQEIPEILRPKPASTVVLDNRHEKPCAECSGAGFIHRPHELPGLRVKRCQCASATDAAFQFAVAVHDRAQLEKPSAAPPPPIPLGKEITAADFERPRRTKA